ncbi:MAG: ketosynthase [Pseudoxanthomonas suwonensis]|nr:ketosynthase [Pseudoxanthomonas suwonensis]
MGRDDAAALLRLLLILAYPLLAHAASLREDGTLAALASLDMLLLVLADALLARRLVAWLLLAAAVAGAWWLARSPWALLPLLLAPTLFVAMVAWLFARSLLQGRRPLISRIVAGLEGEQALQDVPGLARYARRLTLAWALLLGLLALVNLLLALVAVPDGVLAMFGVTPVPSVSQAQWSWFANVATYGLLGVFFIGEYLLRRRRFPDHHRGGLRESMARMARLGPAFWREFMR